MNLQNTHDIKAEILSLAKALGFLDMRISPLTIPIDAQHGFNNFLASQSHGDMQYLARNLDLRFNPKSLVPESKSAIILLAPYLNQTANYHKERLASNDAYISSYALGRDYHKTLKQNLIDHNLKIQNTKDPTIHPTGLQKIY